MESSQLLFTASNIEQKFYLGDETINVLNSCSFTIEKGSFNIIYGPSGSGKSTLLNILSGLQKPSNGKILFEGRDVYEYTDKELAHFRGNHMGVVYQQTYWVDSLSVLENVAIPLYFLGYSRSKAARIAMDALQRVDMAPFAKKSPLLLSGGEQQRVSVARAIVHEPSFIIADEPTGSLDSKNGDMIIALLASYKKDKNRTIVMVTHNMEYLLNADHLLHINDGNCEEINKENVHSTVKSLLRDIQKRFENSGTSI